MRRGTTRAKLGYSYIVKLTTETRFASVAVRAKASDTSPENVEIGASLVRISAPASLSCNKMPNLPISSISSVVNHKTRPSSLLRPAETNIPHQNLAIRSRHHLGLTVIGDQLTSMLPCKPF